MSPLDVLAEAWLHITVSASLHITQLALAKEPLEGMRSMLALISEPPEMWLFSAAVMY